MVNSPTEVLFQCGRDRLISRNIRSLVPDWAFQLPAGWDADSGQLKLQPGEVGKELEAVREDGSTFPVAISFRPLQTEEGVVITSAIRDISQRKKNEERIRELNTNLEERVMARTEELMRSNEELQQFAYIASHDLQEPLRTVSIFAQLLARRYQGQLQGEADQFIKYIVESSERMERLIHDLLDFSRVEARGTDYFARTRCDDVLTDAAENLHSLIMENDAQVTHDDLPVVMADAVQLTRLFQNLLVNSIRYRSEAPPLIHVTAEARDNEWLFSVKDNGIGIEPQYAEKVFGIFKCLHSRDKYPGSGMGLAICRKIVSRHEGRIWVESELGQGATFRFTLPKTRV
jgi:PAS domain S-box-containing protein